MRLSGRWRFLATACAVSQSALLLARTPMWPSDDGVAPEAEATPTPEAPVAAGGSNGIYSPTGGSVVSGNVVNPGRSQSAGLLEVAAGCAGWWPDRFVCRCRRTTCAGAGPRWSLGIQPTIPTASMSCACASFIAMAITTSTIRVSLLPISGNRRHRRDWPQAVTAVNRRRSCAATRVTSMTAPDVGRMYTD